MACLYQELSDQSSQLSLMLQSIAPTCHFQLCELQTNFQVRAKIRTEGKTHRLLLELLVSEHREEYREFN